MGPVGGLCYARLCACLVCCTVLCVLCCGLRIIYVVVAWALPAALVPCALRDFKLLSCVLVCDFLMGALAAVVSRRCAALRSRLFRFLRRCGGLRGRVCYCVGLLAVRMGPPFPLFPRRCARRSCELLLCPRLLFPAASVRLR
jgi:hypothetical protein